MEQESLGFEKSPIEKALLLLWRRRRQILGALATTAAGMFLVYHSWDPYQKTDRRFDQGRNGLFVSSDWLSGKLWCDEEDESCLRLRETQLEEMVGLIGGLGINYVFTLASAVMPGGGLDYEKAAFFERFKNRMPEGVKIIAWTPCFDCRYQLPDAAWRGSLAAALTRLKEDGFDGILVEFKGLRDSDELYPELLAELKQAAPYRFLVGQLLGSVDHGEKSPSLYRFLTFDDEFLKSTVANSDLTVFSLFSTGIPLEKIYFEYARELTERMIRLAGSEEGHQVMGAALASGYAQMPFSFGSTEGMANGVLATRAALEGYSQAPPCYAGLAIYAHYTASPLDWDIFRYYWLRPGE